ncbi:MAG: glycosyltransferase, partial [Proteobacteria bacterium]|nr:glycosyltransferase [Pseudomonadota bacterium]
AIIIIPAYNEEKNIAGVINRIKNVIPDASILVVNDGGEDRTEEIARELGARVMMGLAARKKVVKNYTWENIGEQLERTLKNIMFFA